MWHEITKTFAMADFVRQMTAKKSCMYMANMDHLSICSSSFFSFSFLLLFPLLLFAFPVSVVNVDHLSISKVLDQNGISQA